MIQKYSLHDPPQEKIYYCVKIIIIILIKIKHQSFLVPTNIRLNNDINSINKLNELKERLVSPCLTFDQIWQLQSYGQ